MAFIRHTHRSRCCHECARSDELFVWHAHPCCHHTTTMAPPRHSAAPTVSLNGMRDEQQHPDAASRQAMAARLAQLQDLRLPAALSRQQPPPDAHAVEQHLMELLQRDAAVFLERYALRLQPHELAAFEPLRSSSYEVHHFLTQALQHHEQQQQQQQQDREAATAASRPHRQHTPVLSSTTKNRRLAYMRRLEQRGEYFSEAAMRLRQPLVYQEHIGQFEGLPPPPSAGAPAGQRGFAGSLLDCYDEAAWRQRLQQQLEDEQAATSEHESDSDEEGGGGGGVLTEGRGRPAAGVRAPPAAGAARPTAIRLAGGGAGRQQQQQQVEAAAPAPPPPPAAGSGVDMRPAAMARRRQEFLVDMQRRFLSGADSDTDYAAIDADALGGPSLDDDWLQQQAQDAEDAYFSGAD